MSLKQFARQRARPSHAVALVPPRAPDALGRVIAQPMTVEQQGFVVEQLAQFVPVKTIQTQLKARYGVGLKEWSIERYAWDPKWKPLVDKYRQRFLEALVDVPIYHKRVRLERLEDQWQQMAEEQAATVEAKRTRRKEGREILALAREETREEAATTNILALQFNTLDDAALMKKRDELIQSLASKTITRQEEKSHDPTHEV